ncbi:hypothetical protein SteCoe_17842 [Stentor coeruleus]|uniref:Importin N-terminal domain-containing protein n=1 Tax=Stentor coeruleus TaxID=5963 RepID=A0A1R2BXV9_9CILI|nr:hypothetical protein SteCoe_17842 [Stentor coeruleus]
MEEPRIADILFNLLNSDKSVREEAELEIQTYKQSTPSLLFCSLTNILLVPSNEQIKSLSAVLLKQYIPYLWPKLDISSQELTKQNLLKSLESISNLSLLKKCSDVISEIAIHTCKEEYQVKWHNIVVFVLESLDSNSNSLILSSFQILLTVYPFYIEDFSNFREKLFQSYLKHLESQVLEVRAFAVQAFNLMIAVINTSEAMYYAGLLQNMLKSVVFLCGHSAYLTELCLKSLRDLAETEPMYFRSRILWCLSFTESVCKFSMTPGCKYICLEFITLLLENYPQLISQKKIILEGLFVLFTKIFIESIASINEDIEINYEQLFLGLFRRIVSSIKLNFVEIVLEFCESIDRFSSEWYFVYISINCLMQVVQELDNNEKFQWVVSFVLKNVTNPIPQIRWVSYSAIKAFSEDFPKHFAQSYSDLVVPILISGFSEKNPKILHKVLEATKVFFDYSEGHIHTKHIVTLLPAAANLLCNEEIIEKAFHVIETIIGVFGKNLRNYFDELFDKVLELTRNTQNYEIKAAGLSCLLSLRKVMTRGEIKKYIPVYVNLLKNFMEKGLSDDFVKSHVLNAWKMLCKCLRGDFKDCLEHIVPSLIIYLQNPADNEIEEHLETLLAIIESSPGSYLAYMPTTSDLIVPLITQNSSDTVKILSSSLAAALVKVIKNNSNKEILSGIVPYSRGFLSAIWIMCLDENDHSVLIDIMSSIKSIIEIPGFEYLNKEEILHIGRLVIKILEEKTKNKEEKQNAMKTCSQVFSALFRTHTANSASLLEYVYSNIIGRYLGDSNSDNDKIFALEVISHIIESVGDLIEGSRLKEMVKILVFYMDHPKIQVKITAIDGLVAFCLAVRSEKVIGFMQEILRALEKCLNCVEERMKSVRESAKIAVGMIVKYQRNCLKIDAILPWWIEFLPIKKNKEKARELHDFLADLVINEASIMVDSKNLVKFFITIAYTELCASRTLPKIEKILEMHFETHDKNSFFQHLPQSLQRKFPRYL